MLDGMKKQSGMSPRARFFFFWPPLCLLPFLLLAQQRPDFGPEGLAGFTEAEKKSLAAGEIVLPENLIRTESGETMIEAALVFDRPPEDVWRLLSRTEDQVKYIDEVSKISVISKTPTDDLLEFTTKILIKTVV